MADSAFGVDHGEISKARRGPTGGRHQPGYPSMTHRGGADYFHPTSEQVGAARARRAQQAQDKAGYKQQKADPNFRRGAGGRVPLKAHWKAAGNLPVKATSTALIGGGALYALNNRTKVEKSDRRRNENIALGAVGGAALTDAATIVGGQATKATLKQRRATRGESPNEQRTWRQHKAKYGTGADSFTKYPKSLPDWKGQRALAYKNKAYPAILAAGAAAGGVYGARKEARR